MVSLSFAQLLDIVGRASGEMRRLSKPLVVRQRNPGYVEPSFRVETDPEKDPLSSPILLVSARAAVGKSSLARELSARTGNPLVDLSGRRIADGYFTGRLPKDLASGNVGQQFLIAQSLRTQLLGGQGSLIIDSADEALVSNGPQDFEAALLDLAGLIKETTSERPAAILLGRPDTIDVAHYFYLDQDVPVARIDVRFFDEPSARKFIKLKADRGDPTIPEFDFFLDEFFRRVLGALGANEWEDAESFVGYAPVLDSLAAYYNPDGNFMKVFADLHVDTSTRHVWVLLVQIINAVLQRETEKFAANFGAGDSAKADFGRSVYTTQLQVELLLSEEPLSRPITPDTEPADARWLSELEGKVRGWFRDHPFVSSPERGRNPLRRFTNPAFRDYVVTQVLGGADGEVIAAVKTYFADPDVSPSPILARLALSGGFGLERIGGAALALILSSHSTDFSDEANLHVWPEARQQHGGTKRERPEFHVQLFEPIGLAGELICTLEPDEPISLVTSLRRTTIDAPRTRVVVGEGMQDFALGPAVEITCAEFDAEAVDVRLQAETWGPNVVETLRVSGTTKFVTPQDSKLLSLVVQSAAYPWTNFVTKPAALHEEDDEGDIVRASLEFKRIAKWYVKKSMIRGANYPADVMDTLLKRDRGSILAHDYGLEHGTIVRTESRYELQLDGKGFSVKDMVAQNLANEAYVNFLKSFLRWMKRRGKQFDKNPGLVAKG